MNSLPSARNTRPITLTKTMLLMFAHIALTGVVKIGTKVRNIRLVDSDHDIDCKIDGFGPMSLKSEFVKKV